MVCGKNQTTGIVCISQFHNHLRTDGIIMYKLSEKSLYLGSAVAQW